MPGHILFVATWHASAPLVDESLDFSLKIHGAGIGSALPATHGGSTDGLPLAGGHCWYWMFWLVMAQTGSLLKFGSQPETTGVICRTLHFEVTQNAFGAAPTPTNSK